MKPFQALLLDLPWVVLLTLAVSFGVSGSSEAEEIIFPSLGFEDDVDVVVSPNRQFLVMAEESEGGAEAKVTIIALSPTTGQPLGVVTSGAVPGFEDGVDPVILPAIRGDAEGYPVIIPVESEDGSECGVLLLRTDPWGVPLEVVPIDLGNLGFREDVDLVWWWYIASATAFIPLESEDGSVRGLLALDVDPNDELADGITPWGTCTLLSTDGRSVCSTTDLQVDWLPGLAEGVDPVAYEIVDALRLALPVESEEGGDILLVDFDTHTEPPTYMERHFSVKELNTAGDHPLAFPGWEKDVDLVLDRPTECGLAAADTRVLVPVEGPGGEADLYCLDWAGTATWILSDAATAAGLTVLGYEAGVDLVPLCNLPGVPNHRVAVPLENAAGTDADLWIVDIDLDAGGSIHARAEDPAINPGLVLPGYEIGVDVVRWSEFQMAVPQEGGGEAGLFDIGVNAILLDELIGDPILGFERSVDLTVAPVGDPDRKLYVPVEASGGGDADVLIFPTVGDLGDRQSLETLNPGLELSGFEWDLDLGLVDHWLDGQAWLYLPEEDPDGAPARLRCIPVTAGARILVMATPERGALPATFYTVHGVSGDVLTELDDVWGLETGLDMTNGIGHRATSNSPIALAPAGGDPDTDPTLVYLVESSDAPERPPAEGPRLRFRHDNPFTPPGELRFSLPEGGPARVEIVDPAGRVVRNLVDGVLPTGEIVVPWDGRGDEGGRVASGVYLLRVWRPGGESASKIIVLRN